MIRTILPAAILAGFAVTSSAQLQAELPTPLPADGPVDTFVYDYATKTLTPVDGLDDQLVGSQTTSTATYDNTCTSGFYSPRLPGQEVFDWGTKSAGLTTIVDSFQFAYATSEADTSVGGVGSDIQIAFWSGTGLGFDETGTELARYSFTGLPASVGGGVETKVILVDLVGGFEFCLPDGEIGYSYCINDASGTTGPLIGSITACPNGQADAFDRYDCGGTNYAGTFFFGGSPEATFYMLINEDDGSQVASQTNDFGSGENLNFMIAPAPPVLGTDWQPAYVDIEGNAAGGDGTGTSTALWFSDKLAAGVSTNFGELLIDPTSTFLISDTVGIVAFNAAHSVEVPEKDLSLLDLGTFYVQAVAMGGAAPIRLSTMIEANAGF